MPVKPAKCYTHQSKPPYTRKEYIHGVPPPKISKFTMGNPRVNAEIVVKLVALESGFIRDSALEAARVSAYKYLSTNVGDEKYFMIFKTYPHQVLREHKMMAFAGADRLQEGMRLAFGKPVALAVRTDIGTEIAEVYGFKEHLDHIKEALKRASYKLPIRTRIVVIEAGNKKQ